jgi:hypothetical protein
VRSTTCRGSGVNATIAAAMINAPFSNLFLPPTYHLPPTTYHLVAVC